MRDRGTDYNRACDSKIGGLVAKVHGGATPFQTLGYGRGTQIRAADTITHPQQDFGKAAHADTADTYEVDRL
jgi:hypothetical protein